MTDFHELIKIRRAIRQFEDRKVSPEIIKSILTESCQAPSASNERPWRFIVIHNQDLIKRISDESKANLLSRIEENPNVPIKKYRDVLVLPEFNVFYNAPCLIFIAGPQDRRTLKVDCALCAAYLMFSAANRGLGTCWVDLGSDIRNPELIREIGLPEDHQIVAPIIIGYPQHIPEMSPERTPQIIKTIE
jgi:nitroreductase